MDELSKGTDDFKGLFCRGLRKGEVMEDRYLFKAKRIDNGEWEIGSLIMLPNGKYEIANGCTNPPDSDPMWKSCVITHLVDPSTICQCTGLKDKNGKLIWENDIVDRKERYPEIVKYKDGDWTIDYSYACNMETGCGYCNLGFYVLERKCVEIIGNTFDNPELLENKIGGRSIHGESE